MMVMEERYVGGSSGDGDSYGCGIGDSDIIVT